MVKPPPPIREGFNPGGARYCTDHNRYECNSQKSRGRGQCHKLAVRGMKNCDMHQGMSKDLSKAMGEAKITAWSAIGQAGEVISAPMAVLGVLQMTWLRLAVYNEMLRKQVTRPMIEAQEVIEGAEEDPFAAAESANAALTGEIETTGETSGLIGQRIGAAGKDGVLFAQGEEIRALVQLEERERHNVVKFAKTAHDMGISERIVGLAERWSDVVATRIGDMMAELDLTEAQQAKVPALVQKHLSSIDMSMTEPLTHPVPETGETW